MEIKIFSSSKHEWDKEYMKDKVVPFSLPLNDIEELTSRNNDSSA
jgi:hypothetical protein